MWMDRTRSGVAHCGALGSNPMGDNITYSRTQEGFAYLAVVIDLFSRRGVGPLSRFAGIPLPGSGIDAQPADN